MLSVEDVVPDAVLDALGSAKGVGRDRWEELKKLVLNPAAAERAKDLVREEMFLSQTTDETRFQYLVVASKPRRRLASVQSRNRRQPHGCRLISRSVWSHGKGQTAL